MDDKARLNPSWLAGFLILNKDKSPDEKRVTGLSYNYTFKIDETLHREIKLKAIEHDLPMNEFVGRLLTIYYK
jgi:predicted HicB family RNase H-like nuclease